MPSTIADVSAQLKTETTTAVTYEVELRAIALANGYQLEAWYNLDKDAVPEIETITISQADLATVDAYYRVEVVGPATTKEFTHFFDVSETPDEEDVAAELAALINLHPEVQAVQGGTGALNTAIVKAVNPGTAGVFTLNVACLAASDNSSISGTPIAAASTQTASGTGKMRKILAANVVPTINANDKPELGFSTMQAFNGAAVPVATNRSAQALTHGSTMSSIVAANA